MTVTDPARRTTAGQTELEALVAVYSFVFPEVRALLGTVEALDPALYLTTTPLAAAEAAVASAGFDPPLTLAGTADGRVDLDGCADLFLERLTGSLAGAVTGLDGFGHRYGSAGSSQGLFHLLAEAAAAGEGRIAVLEGEYEGFGHYAAACGLEVVSVNPERTDPVSLPPMLWFISNPSARDGNWVDKELIDGLCAAGHRIVLDLAYLGMAEGHLDVSDSQIVAVVSSLSKPWGLFRFRVGAVFSRRPVASLYAQRWFADLGRLMLGIRVVEAYPPGVLAARYRHLQGAAIDMVAARTGLELVPSDVFLLATLPTGVALDTFQRQLVAPYARGDGHRFCLTPYFEQLTA